MTTPSESLFDTEKPGEVRKLPCGCWGMLHRNEGVYIDAEAFVCEQKHKQGQRLTLADVASLAVAKALTGPLGAIGGDEAEPCEFCGDGPCPHDCIEADQ